MNKLHDVLASLTSHESEQSVIGAVLLDNNCFRRVSEVKPDHFSSRPHQLIWKAITAALRYDEPVDLITLSDKLESYGCLDEVGGFAYLTDLAKNTPSAANVGAYSEIVLDRAYRRSVVKALTESIRNIQDLRSPAESITADIVREIGDIYTQGMGGKSSAVHISELCKAWTEELEGRFENGGAGGLTTGFAGLDDLLHPKNVVDGALFVVGARPKMGKTAFSLKTVDHITGLGHTGLVFSMEMSSTQLVERSLVQIGNVKTKAMYPTSGGFDTPDKELAKILHTIGDLRSRHLYISTKPAVSLFEMENTIRRHHAMSKGKLKAVWVDYLTLMDVDPTGNRHDLGYAAITRRLKVLAKELNLVVFLLIQLNRGLENRADKRPMPSDGRETGQIEQDCDYWLGIYRDHVYNESSDPSHCELLLRLNRHGAAGTVHAKFVGGRFDDWLAPLPNSAGKGGYSY